MTTLQWNWGNSSANGGLRPGVVGGQVGGMLEPFLERFEAPQPKRLQNGHVFSKPKRLQNGHVFSKPKRLQNGHVFSQPKRLQNLETFVHDFPCNLWLWQDGCTLLAANIEADAEENSLEEVAEIDVDAGIVVDDEAVEMVEDEVADSHGDLDEHDQSRSAVDMLQNVEDRCRTCEHLTCVLPVLKFAPKFISFQPMGPWEDRNRLRGALEEAACKDLGDDVVPRDDEGLRETVVEAGFPKTCTQMLHEAGLLDKTGSADVERVVEHLKAMEKGMEAFCYQVRLTENMISPTQLSGKTDHLNSWNHITHILALARQYSAVHSKRCSRSQCWMATQQKLCAKATASADSSTGLSPVPQF